MLQTLMSLLELYIEVVTCYMMNVYHLPVCCCECKVNILVYISSNYTILLMHGENNYIEWFHNFSLLAKIH
jgi:hypothetical protein